MEYTKIGKINEYVSQSINPMKTPDTIFEMYSVPAYDTGHPEYLRGDEIASSKIVVRKNDILLCKINPRINRVWVVNDESDKQNIASSEWIVIRTKTYNPEYLAWYFRTPNFQKLMTSEVTGIGGSLTRAQPKRVAGYSVPVLEREKQDEIVCVLNRVKNLIYARKQELQELDNLIKSRFVEMFGEPVLNSLGWKTQRFDELCENLDSRRKPITSGDRVSGIYPYYGASGIVDYVEDYIFDEDILLISEDGANLLARSTPIAFSVSGKVWVNNHAHVVKFDNMCTQKYIEQYFAMIDISERITGSAQPKLNQAMLNSMIIPVPEIDLQERFLCFVEQVDKLM